ncbi:hypothetical protein H0H93_012241 [Arthromyces matolae]|nr:hypothetical protein H0H93_012241 [Arthromyces matolae]
MNNTYYGIEASLLRKLIQAIPDAIIHHQAFEAFTEGLQKEHASELLKWKRMVEEWEVEKREVKDIRERSKPDPYLVKEDSVSVHEIEKQLAEKETRNVQNGGGTTDATPSDYIISGLSILDSQLALKPEAAKREQTANQKAVLQRKRTLLLKKIKKFHQVQLSFTGLLPAVDYSAQPPEEIPLRLPSELTAEQRVSIQNLVSIEDSLREAHANQALGDLRKQLRLRTFSLKFKNENANSQGTYTRMRALQDQITARIRAAAVRYRAAREALMSLRGSGSWEDSLRVLKDHDIRGVNEHSVVEEEATAHKRALTLANGEIATLSTLHLTTGDGHRTASWIWFSVSSAELNNDPDASLHDGIRLEWLKARARAQRWKEEVKLVDEEMRRVLQYTEWKGTWWDGRASCRNTSSPSLNEGLRAYAKEQASIERARKKRWESKWQMIRVRAQDALAEKLGGFTGGDLRGNFPTIEVDLEEEDLEEDSSPEWSDDDE